MSTLPMVGKMMIALGAVSIIIGVVLLFSPKIPWLGRLPGDISVERQNFSFHFPIVTCIILSIILTVVLNLFMRNR